MYTPAGGYPQVMTRMATWIERGRNTFWLFPALMIALAIVAGLLLPRLDTEVTLPEALAFTATPDTARSTLQLITTLAVSIAGISFSVIVVALVLTSQQLSPRVLRSFQRNSLNQAVLGLFLATAVFSMYVLSAVEDDPQRPVPELGTTLAMLMAAVSMLLFVFFLHHMIRSLNAAAIIRRIAADGHREIDNPYPTGAGRDPDDNDEAQRTVRELTSRCEAVDVHAPRAGYLAGVQAAAIVATAEEADAFVEQEALNGQFVVTGTVLARIWCPSDRRDALAARVEEAFVLNEERMTGGDVAYTLRQLVDIALRGLSPSLNDPTTAENAMDSVVESLVRLSRQPEPADLRVSGDGVPRMRVRTQSFDDLVRLGFDQVRRDGASSPSFAVRLLELLADLRRNGGNPARRSDELARQAELVREDALRCKPLSADAELIEKAYERLHSTGSAGTDSRPIAASRET